MLIEGGAPIVYRLVWKISFQPSQRKDAVVLLACLFWTRLARLILRRPAISGIIPHDTYMYLRVIFCFLCRRQGKAHLRTGHPCLRGRGSPK